MRKWMAIVLLGLIFFSQVGYYGLFAVEQGLIRYEQKRKLLSTLGNEELERIPYHPSMTFMDDDQEFSLDGQQYDIVRTTVENGTRVYYAVNDKNETRLLRKLAETGRSHGQDNGAKKGLLKIPTIFYSGYTVRYLVFSARYRVMHPVVPHHRGTRYNKETVQPPDPA